MQFCLLSCSLSAELFSVLGCGRDPGHNRRQERYEAERMIDCIYVPCEPQQGAIEPSDSRCMWVTKIRVILAIFSLLFWSCICVPSAQSNTMVGRLQLPPD